MKEFEKWFRKAEIDLLVIKNNLSSNEVPIDACCFHAQQASEKYLKAYLVSKLVIFPKTLDLVKLVKHRYDCLILQLGQDILMSLM